MVKKLENKIKNDYKVKYIGNLQDQISNPLFDKYYKQKENTLIEEPLSYIKNKELYEKVKILNNCQTIDTKNTQKLLNRINYSKKIIVIGNKKDQVSNPLFDKYN